MSYLLSLYKRCNKSESNFYYVILNAIFVKILYKKKLYLHQKVIIEGIRNIYSTKRIEVGLNYVGFMHRTDKTYLNIKGKLIINGNFSIGRGCRFDIGENAIVTFGNGGYINANTKLIIMHNCTIGDNCAISWDCQIIDEDFHNIIYPGKISTNKNDIYIGNHVLVGSKCTILKGANIPNGCVIASGSIVNKYFLEENCLLGGIPAKVIRRNISWN